MHDYFRNIYLGIWTIMVGMQVTFKHLFTPSVTLQYPEEKMELPEKSRMRLFMNWDDCIGCLQCEKACPVECITINTVKALPTDDLGVTSNGRAKKLWVLKFDIDMAKCCYCELCVFPCPTECIYMTPEYEFAQYDRLNLIYNFTPFTPQGAIKKERELEETKQKALAERQKPPAADKIPGGEAPQDPSPTTES